MKTTDEAAKLAELMAKPGSEYWKGPMAPIHQSRYREILEGVVRSGVSLAKRRIAEIKTLMSQPQSAYWRGPHARDLQAEYRGLVKDESESNPTSAEDR